MLPAALLEALEGFDVALEDELLAALAAFSALASTAFADFALLSDSSFSALGADITLVALAETLPAAFSALAATASFSALASTLASEDFSALAAETFSALASALLKKM